MPLSAFLSLMVVRMCFCCSCFRVDWRAWKAERSSCFELKGSFSFGVWVGSIAVWFGFYGKRIKNTNIFMQKKAIRRN